MKKLKAKLLILTALFGMGSFNAQVVETGTKLIDVYTGYPDLYRAVITSAYQNSGGTGLKIGGTPPLGIRFENLVADKIGLGVNINYTNAYASYDETSTDTSGVTNTYNYKISVPRLRAMATFNLHFGNSDVFDGYFQVGAGYNSTKFVATTTDPDFTDDEIALKGLSPVAFRLGVGGRYFFSDMLGMNFEIGLGGGPLLALGLSAKL